MSGSKKISERFYLVSCILGSLSALFASLATVIRECEEVVEYPVERGEYCEIGARDIVDEELGS